MFALPPVEKCKENAARLKEAWLKSADISPKPEMLREAADYFRKCLAFHHLTFVQPQDLFETLSSRNLLSYRQAALQNKGKPSTSRTLDIDLSLGLDDYVFLSFAMHPVSTGPNCF